MTKPKRKPKRKADEEALAEEARKWDSRELKPTDPGWEDAPEAIPRKKGAEEPPPPNPNK